MTSSAKLASACWPGVAQTRSARPSADPVAHSKSPTSSATRYVDMRGVVAKVTVCLPAAGPGTSETWRPLEMPMSPSSRTTLMSNVALSAGSSKQGNMRRASVASSWVAAYFRFAVVVR